MEWWQSFYGDIYRVLIETPRWTWLVDGLWISLQVSLYGILLGIVLGLIIAGMKMTKGKVLGINWLDKIVTKFLNGIAYIYLDVIRGTPVLVQLFIWRFVIFSGTGVSWLNVAIIAVGFNSGAYVAEIIRAGVLSIDKGQTEAGRSLGLTAGTTMGFIVMPQAIKNILPTLVNEFIILIKETAIVGFIGVPDLMQAARRVEGVSFVPWVPYLAVAIIYYVIIKILTVFLGKFEQHLRKSDVR